MHLIADAIRAGGARRAAIRDALAQVGRARPAYEGVTGRIAFDDNGDVPDKTVLVGVVRGDRIVLAEER
jgi:ABC-type branched-subunit amino acid transport system substrate-binding protein